MMNMDMIEKIALMTMDMLPKQNIIGGTYKEIEEGFKSMGNCEKINYAINISDIYAKYLEREFKIRSLLDILEHGIDTQEAHDIAEEIRANKDGSFAKAADLIAKIKIKDKVASKRNAKLEEILSKEKIDG